MASQFDTEMPRSPYGQITANIPIGLGVPGNMPVEQQIGGVSQEVAEAALILADCRQRHRQASLDLKQAEERFRSLSQKLGHLTSQHLGDVLQEPER